MNRAGAALFLALVSAGPAMLVVDALTGAGSAPSGSARLLGLAASSVRLAAAGAALAAAAGALAAAATITAAPRERVVLAGLAPLGLALPSTVSVTAWLALARPGATLGALDRGFLPCALVLAAGLWPVVWLLVDRAFRALPAEALLAGRLAATEDELLRRAVAPWLARSLAAGAALSFAAGLLEHAVPAMLDYPVIAIEIQAEFAASGNAVSAAAIGLVIALPAAAVLASVLLALRRLPVPLAPLDLGTWRWPLAWRAAALAGRVVILASVALPVVALSSRASFSTLPLRAATEVVRSLGEGAIAATGAALLAWATAGQVLEGTRSGRACALAAVVTLGLPASLIGVGLARLFAILPAAFADSPVPLVAGYLARALPIALLLALEHRRTEDPAPRAAARLALSAPTRWRAISWPLARGTLVAIGLVTLLGCQRDLELGLLLSAPGAGTPSARLYNWLHAGAHAEAAALCLAQLAITVIVWTAGSRACSS